MKQKFTSIDLKTVNVFQIGNAFEIRDTIGRLVMGDFSCISDALVWSKENRCLVTDIFYMMQKENIPSFAAQYN